MSDSFAVVRNILMHIAAGVLVEETPAEAEALLVERSVGDPGGSPAAVVRSGRATGRSSLASRPGLRAHGDRDHSSGRHPSARIGRAVVWFTDLGSTAMAEDEVGLVLIVPAAA